MSLNKTKDEINELYPEAGDFMIEPMLIHSSTDAQLRAMGSSGNYFGQLKKDGALYMFVKTENHSYLFGRTVSKKTGLLSEKSNNVPHIMDALSASLPANTVVLGEIYYPGKSSKNVTEIMGCLPAKAIQRQNSEYGLIHYYIYDILYYAGINFIKAGTGNRIRYNIIAKLYENSNLDGYDFIELAQVWDDNLYERIGKALSEGEEGMVIKQNDAPYVPGKRPTTNLKAKKVDFADAVIIGFEEPTKEYYGKEIETWPYWISTDPENPARFEGDGYEKYMRGELYPATKPYFMGWYNSRIKIGAYNSDGAIVEIGVIHSGISDEMKKNMSEHPAKYLNHTCAIQCMELDKKEKTIRHGFFVQMRDDKDPADCTIDSIFG